jgi:hypothetical protein
VLINVVPVNAYQQSVNQSAEEKGQLSVPLCVLHGKTSSSFSFTVAAFAPVAVNAF